MIKAKKWVASVILLALVLIIGYLNHDIKNETMFKNLTGLLIYSEDRNIFSFDLETFSKKNLYSTEGTPYGIFCVDLSPDSNRIIFSLSHTIEGERLSLIKKDTKRDQIFLNGENKESFRGLSWSPNGRKIAIIKGMWVKDAPIYKLYTVNTDGTGIKKLSDINLYFYKPSWSPDSKRIAFTGFGNMNWLQKQEAITQKGLIAMNLNIYITDVENGITQKIIDSGFGPSWSPDGRYIAFYEPVPNSNKSSLKILDTKTQTISYLMRNKNFTGSPVWFSNGKFLVYVRYKMIFLPPERRVFELYSLEKKRSIKIFEAGRIHDFTLRQHQ